MTSSPTNDLQTPSSGVAGLLRGDFPDHPNSAPPVLATIPALIWIVFGAGVFGAALGSWRSGSQAVITAVKFPILVLLTTFGNAALNFMLAAQFGFHLRWSESLHYFLLAFVAACVCLAAFSPLILFLIWNMPSPTPGIETTPPGYFLLQLITVMLLAASGIVGHRRLLQKMSRVISAAVARKVFWSWLVINLLLGSQLAWILRPFVGLPSLPVEFFRPRAFSGNFYETLYLAVSDLLKN